MAANGYAQAGRPNPIGHWGKWRGVTCSADGCDKPARCRGMCASHYEKARTAEGHKAPSRSKEGNRKRQIKYRYGIAPADYDRLLADQGGVCAICGRGPGECLRSKTKRATYLCIDHCHTTGKVRGLLCHDCNLAIGHAGTEELLRAAIAYLRDRT